MQSLQLQGGETGSLRTLSGLSGWQVQFFYKDQVSWANCQSTGDAPAPGASAAQSSSLPKGVRIILSFEPGSGISGDLTRDTRVEP